MINLETLKPDIIVNDVELYEAHRALNLVPEKYYVSIDGQMFSRYINKFLRFTSDEDGYLVAHLKRSSGIGRKMSVAKVVLTTFKGTPPGDMEDPTVEHIDGNKRNNNISNLKWLERRINSSVRVHTRRGEECKNSVLKEPQVHEICKLLIYTKMSYRKIALRFNVSIYTVIDIYKRESWVHLTKDYDFDRRKKIKTETRLSEYPVILSHKDVQHILGHCKNTVVKLLRSGQIYYYKEGRRVRIPKIALIEYMEKNGIEIK